MPGRSCGPGPGLTYSNIHVGVQRRGRRDELLDLHPGDAVSATWTLDCTPTVTPTGIDITGPYIQDPPGGRFIYPSWVTMDDTGACTLFRRAKLWLDAISPDVLAAAQHSGCLTGRVGLTDTKGHPRCAAVRPPLIEWRATPPV